MLCKASCQMHKTCNGHMTLNTLIFRGNPHPPKLNHQKEALRSQPRLLRRQAEKTPVAALAISHTARVPLLPVSPSLQQATDGRTPCPLSAAHPPHAPRLRPIAHPNGDRPGHEPLGRLPLFRACSPLANGHGGVAAAALLPEELPSVLTPSVGVWRSRGVELGHSEN